MRIPSEVPRQICRLSLGVSTRLHPGIPTGILRGVKTGNPPEIPTGISTSVSSGMFPGAPTQILLEVFMGTPPRVGICSEASPGIL